MCRGTNPEQIVAVYVRRNQVASGELASLIPIVYSALAGLGRPATEATGAHPGGSDTAICSARPCDLPRMRLYRQHASIPFDDKPRADPRRILHSMEFTPRPRADSTVVFGTTIRCGKTDRAWSWWSRCVGRSDGTGGAGNLRGTATAAARVTTNGEDMIGQTA
jgi:hypothetical protein